MKRKFTGILMGILIVCMSLFAGCSLVETNSSKLYNAVVEEITNSDGKVVATITNRELLSSYSSYGNYYLQYGYSQEEALNMTITQLENRKITLLKAEEDYGVNKEGKNLSALYKTYLFEQTESSLYENLKSFYNEIVGNKSNDDSTDEKITFNGYTKKAKLERDEKGDFVIKSVDEYKEFLSDYRQMGSDKDYQKDKEQMYIGLLDYVRYDENYTKAFEKYLRQLKTAEFGLNLSTDTKSIFMRELDRLYQINYENYLLERYSSDNQNHSIVSAVTPQNILDAYANKVRASYTKYQLEQNSSYDSDVQNSLKDMYYFKSGKGVTTFFTVANVLFKFNDAQTAQYTKLKEKYDAKDGTYTYSEYQADLDDLYKQIEPKIRVLNTTTGEYEEQNNNKNEEGYMSVDDVINLIETKLDSAKNSTLSELGNTINDFIYEYGEDTGMFNAESNYVIGVDEDGNAISSFVEEFNKAGIDLYNGKFGENAGTGEIGDYVVTKTNYGIHLIIYTGKCENLFGDRNIDLSFKLTGDEAIQKLYNTRVNLLVDKTYFDVLYDELYADNYSYYEMANLNTLRENYNFRIYRGRIADSIK